MDIGKLSTEILKKVACGPVVWIAVFWGHSLGGGGHDIYFDNHGGKQHSRNKACGEQSDGDNLCSKRSFVPSLF